MDKKFAVLGSPIQHSKSPSIHAAAYRVLGEDWSYARAEVKKGGLKSFIEDDGRGFTGFSVTMPLKDEAFQFAAVVDETSQLTKASNTLVKVSKDWHAYNTDVFGMIKAISTRKSERITSSVVIGSGATATSALVAIAKLAPGSKVDIMARNKVTRKQLLEFGQQLGLITKKVTFVAHELLSADLTIATLPGGALDDLAAKLSKQKQFKPNGLLLDVAYDPWPSQIADVWSINNRPVVSGLDMLIWQAIAQIRIFTFNDPTKPLPNEVAVVQAMRNAIEDDAAEGRIL